MKTQAELLTDFDPEKKINGSLIGIDYGNIRIGVAISDTRRQMAFALKTISKLNELDQIIADRKPVGFVVGMPYEPEGNEGKMAHQVRLFCNRIIEKYTLPVYCWDERYSSSDAANELYRAGATGKKQKQYLDAHAAAVILQRALDTLNKKELKR